MKNILLYDLKKGLARNKIILIVPIIISIIINIMAYIDLKSLNISFKNSGYVGEIYMYIFGGMKEYIPSFEDGFVFPTTWLAVYVVPLVITLIYPINDLRSQGCSNLVRIKSRELWWKSKYFWCVIYNAYYFFVISLGIWITIFITNFSKELSINRDNMEFIFNIIDDADFVSTRNINPIILIIPLILFISLGVLQLALSFLTKPYVAFTLILTVLISSAYLYNFCAFANIGMLYRLDFIVKNGISFRNLFLLNILVIVASYIVGKNKLKKMDIIGEI